MKNMLVYLCDNMHDINLDRQPLSSTGLDEKNKVEK